ncbi:hypothetical protein PAHAL_9G197300 [Panicum hallii]|uniref:Uncharacterized protein n=1 Tax=Panicum hallii TaxID=206008 RepID=A0A2T8I1S9_9POAL|nr:hypothetical protein PAHAL_9G197300 [Panicum hallii]
MHLSLPIPPSLSHTPLTISLLSLTHRHALLHMSGSIAYIPSLSLLSLWLFAHVIYTQEA